MQPAYWQSKWKRESWMRVLFGQTLRHSQELLTCFVEKWISSQEAIPVSPSQQQDSEKALKTQDTFSRIYAKLSRQSSLPFASSRMSQDTSVWDSRTFTKAYEVWVTELRRDCLQRRKLAHLTKENGCSSWPTAHGNCVTGAGTQGREGGENLQTTVATWATPTSRDHKDGACANVPTNCLLGRQVLRTQPGQTSSSDGQNSHPLWRTPANQAAGVKVDRLQGDLGSRLYDKETGRNAQYGLEQQVETMWHTPHGIANTDKSGKRSGPSGNELGRQANRQMWPTARASDGPDESSHARTWSGTDYNLHNASRDWSNNSKGKRLNALFVEWLMGVPLGWTSIE